MTTDQELTKAAETILSPRMVTSDRGTAWRASIEEPAQLLARHYLADRKGDEAITEEWLLKIGFEDFEVRSIRQLRFYIPFKLAPNPTYLLCADVANILESPWDLISYPNDGDRWEGTMIAEQITTRRQLLSLLTALGIEVTQ